MKKFQWKKCCKKEFKRLWDITPPPQLLHYIGGCPTCGHFIGITSTSEKEAKEFLKGVDIQTKN